jgi:pimeloyl-ACP methyl ester carboxylesterase
LRELALTAKPNGRGNALRLFISIVGSQVAGLAVAIFLVTGPVAGGSEPTITGSVLLAFGLGWGLLTLLSTRFTDQPQRWAVVPAASMGLVGLGLIVLQPSTDMIGILSWIWPLALVALVVYMVVNARASLHSHLRRWVLYPVFAILVLMAVGGTAEAIMELGDRATYPTTGRLIDVGDHSLWIDCSGTRSPTVVLESGLAESSFYWARISAAVAPTTKVCVYDRAGRGGSEEAPAPQDGLAVALDLHTLLSASGNAGPYVLVGHSSGGVYVRIFAATYPEEVAGMVLLDSQPPDPFTSLPDYPAFYSSTPTLYGILPPVARLGVLRLAYASAFADLPAPARNQERADQASVRLQVSARDEVAQLRASLQEARALTSLGALPLVVVTAESEAPAGWVAAQDGLVSLSTNSVHRVLPEMTHVGLITSEVGATVSSKAILDVVAAVRTGADVAN